MPSFKNPPCTPTPTKTPMFLSRTDSCVWQVHAFFQKSSMYSNSHKNPYVFVPDRFMCVASPCLLSKILHVLQLPQKPLCFCPGQIHVCGKSMPSFKNPPCTPTPTKTPMFLSRTDSCV